MKGILAYSLLTLFSVALPFGADAQYEEILNQYFSFAADENTKLMVSNKYGNITCETWDKDSIGVSVKISCVSKKRESLNRIMNSVKIDQINFGNTIELETAFVDNASLIKSYLGKLDPFNTNELNIEYLLNFPDGIEMDLINEFGNISIEQSTSDIDIELEYGDLRLESMTGDLNLDLKSGRLIGRQLKRANIDARNCDIKLKSIDKAILDMSHCDTKIDKIDFARIELSGGELNLEEVNTLSGTVSSNADLNIELLNADLEVKLKNSSILIEEFDEEVSKVIIDEISSIVDLNISNFAFSLEADVEESKFSVPKSITNIDRVIHDERKQARTIKFNYGDNGASQSKLKLTGLRGSIILIED
jgi:hypothetical protein